jgi:hypothetical protein
MNSHIWIEEAKRPPLKFSSPSPDLSLDELANLWDMRASRAFYRWWFSLPKSGWRDPDDPGENPREVMDILVANHVGDFFDRFYTGAQQPPRPIDARPFDIKGRWHPGVGREQPGQLTT